MLALLLLSCTISLFKLIFYLVFDCGGFVMPFSYVCGFLFEIFCFFFLSIFFFWNACIFPFIFLLHKKEVKLVKKILRTWFFYLVFSSIFLWKLIFFFKLLNLFFGNSSRLWILPQTSNTRCALSSFCAIVMKRFSFITSEYVCVLDTRWKNIKTNAGIIILCPKNEK